jgi:hypothetical protein
LSPRQYPTLKLNLADLEPVSIPHSVCLYTAPYLETVSTPDYTWSQTPQQILYPEHVSTRDPIPGSCLDKRHCNQNLSPKRILYPEPVSCFFPRWNLFSQLHYLEPDRPLGAPDQFPIQHVEAGVVQLAQDRLQDLGLNILRANTGPGTKIM